MSAIMENRRSDRNTTISGFAPLYAKVAEAIGHAKGLFSISKLTKPAPSTALAAAIHRTDASRSSAGAAERVDRVAGLAWRKLYSYWVTHHVGGRPPSRADIDPPFDIPRLLPNLMLIDVMNAGFCMRLVGSEIARRTGANITGGIVKPSQMPSSGMPPFSEFLTRMTATGAPILFHVKHNPECANGAWGILLPLVDSNGLVVMVLGGLFFEPGPLGDVMREWEPSVLRECILADELAQVDLPVGDIAQTKPSTFSTLRRITDSAILPSETDRIHGPAPQK